MLNRNNLTLSALSNRLNLGTRSLVLSTSVDNNGTTLRLRHAHHDVMRKAAEYESVTSIPVEARAIPPAFGPAAASAPAFFKAAGGSWKPDAADAWFVPIPSPSQTQSWQGWRSSQPMPAQRSGSGARPSSRSRVSADDRRILEPRRRPDGRRPEAVEYAGTPCATPLVAKRFARAAVAE